MPRRPGDDRSIQLSDLRLFRVDDLVLRVHCVLYFHSDVLQPVGILLPDRETERRSVGVEVESAAIGDVTGDGPKGWSIDGYILFPDERRNVHEAHT